MAALCAWPRRRPQTIGLPILIFAALLLVACSDDPGPQDKVYRHAVDGTPTSLDPARASTLYSATVVVNIFDTLYRYKYLTRPYELAPNLALGLPGVSDDGRIYTFRIRRDARFTDDPAFPEGVGRPVTVHDLIYSLKRHFDPATRSQGAWLWRDRIVGLDDWAEFGADYERPVEGLRPIDDHTLEVHLVEPFPQLTYTFANAFSAIVPREAVEHYGAEFAIRPVGSGPFRLTSFNSSRAAFEVNPNFIRDPLDLAAEGFDPERHTGLGLEPLDGGRYPFLDRLEIHFIEERSARWSSFASGNEVDIVMVPNEQIDRVLTRRSPIEFAPEILAEFHGLAGRESGFVYGGFNMDDPRFGHHPDPEQDAANRALRCAVRDAYDWQARNQSFYSGLAEVFPGVIPPAVPEFDPDLSADSVTRNVERATTRLARHGWNADTLPTLAYGYYATVQQRQMFEQLRAQLGEIGYPTERVMPEVFASFGDYYRAITNVELDLFFLSWTLGYPDAQNTLQLFYGPNAAPGANSYNYRNPEFDALYERSQTLQSGPERTALYRAMNRMVIDDCVVLSGLSRTRIHLWRKNAIMVPDRETLGGYFIRFVDLAATDEDDR
jgi:oligopeptide transport system substrate-binding protein